MSGAESLKPKNIMYTIPFFKNSYLVSTVPVARMKILSKSRCTQHSDSSFYTLNQINQDGVHTSSFTFSYVLLELFRMMM